MRVARMRGAHSTAMDIFVHMGYNVRMALRGLRPNEDATIMPIHISDFHDPLEGIYTFVARSGENVNIASERLFRWTTQHASTLDVHLVPVKQRLARQFQRDNVVSKARVMELIFRFEEGITPLIFAKDGNMTNGAPDVMLVDGHHRYVLCAALGIREAPAYLLEREQWEPFRIIGMEDISEDELRAVPVMRRHY